MSTKKEKAKAKAKAEAEANAGSDAQEPKSDKKGKAKLVKMTRKFPTKPGGPLKADVHPDQVEAYQATGWAVA